MKTWNEVKNLFYYYAIKLHKTNPEIEVDDFVSAAFIAIKGKYDSPYLAKNIRYAMLKLALKNKRKCFSIDEGLGGITHFDPGYAFPVNDFSRVEIKDMAVHKLKRMILDNDSGVYSFLEDAGLNKNSIGRLFGLKVATVNKYLRVA